MELSAETYALATGLVFVIALVFSMLGLGEGMLYVPVFKWLELPVKAIAVPLSLLLNGVTTHGPGVECPGGGHHDHRRSVRMG